MPEEVLVVEVRLAVSAAADLVVEVLQEVGKIQTI
jgi:hypothetical protein